VIVRGKGNRGRNPGALEFRVTGREHRHGDGVVQELEVVTDVQSSDVTMRRLLAHGRVEADPPTTKAEQAAEIITDELADGEWHDAGPIRATLAELELNGPSVVSSAKEQAKVASRQRPGAVHGGWEWRLDKPTGGQNRSRDLFSSSDSDPRNRPDPQQPRSECQSRTPGTSDPDRGARTLPAGDAQ
jgi:hypothetical protein